MPGRWDAYMQRTAKEDGRPIPASTKTDLEIMSEAFNELEKDKRDDTPVSKQMRKGNQSKGKSG